VSEGTLVTEGTGMTLAGPIVDRLRCPTCRREVRPLEDGDGVECLSGHVYRMRSGYLDCSGTAPIGGTTDRTFASFGFEWNTFDEVRDEDQEFAEVYFRDLDLAGLAGQVGLDAGCGKGRYSRFFAEHLGSLVALDGSSAVEAAVRNLGSFPTVLVVKSDLRDAPFAPESFDFISSLGVLHHLDEPRRGFERLVALLAPTGQMLLYLYSRPQAVGIRGIALWAASVLRTVTVRLPHRLLKMVSAPIAVALYLGVVAPGRYGEKRGVAPLSGLPMAAYRGKSLHSLVLDTFDRLSAPVEHRYVWEELAPWFEDADMVVHAARDEAGWFILASKS
jgi:SAM-dependent methyltransferase